MAIYCFSATPRLRSRPAAAAHVPNSVWAVNGWVGRGDAPPTSTPYLCSIFTAFSSATPASVSAATAASLRPPLSPSSLTRREPQTYMYMTLYAHHPTSSALPPLPPLHPQDRPFLPSMTLMILRLMLLVSSTSALTLCADKLAALVSNDEVVIDSALPCEATGSVDVDYCTILKVSVTAKGAGAQTYPALPVEESIGTIQACLRTCAQAACSYQYAPLMSTRFEPFH